jgi:hypothetical protein
MLKFIMDGGDIFSKGNIEIEDTRARVNRLKRK